MRITVTTVDHAPQELRDQLPLVIDLLREIPGDDRPDYWLGKVQRPIGWLVENLPRQVTHVVVAARWEGIRIEPGVESLPVGIAYVTDPSVLADDRLDFTKCSYVTIGLCTETSRGNDPQPSDGILRVTIARAFGTGNRR
jgi:hypothetical protein